MPCQQTPSPQRVLLVLILILCRWNRGNLIVGNKFWPCTLWQTSSNWKFHEFISFSIDSIPISTNGGFAIAQVVSTTSFCKAWVSIHAKCQNPPYCFANSYALKTWMSVAKWLRILGSQPNKSKRFLPLNDSKILLFLVLQTIGILPESPHVTASEDLCSSRRSSCQATKIESSWPNKKGDLLDDPKNSQPPAEHSQLGPQRFLLDLCFLLLCLLLGCSWQFLLGVVGVPVPWFEQRHLKSSTWFQHISVTHYIPDFNKSSYTIWQYSRKLWTDAASMIYPFCTKTLKREFKWNSVASPNNRLIFGWCHVTSYFDEMDSFKKQNIHLNLQGFQLTAEKMHVQFTCPQNHRFMCPLAYESLYFTRYQLHPMISLWLIDGVAYYPRYILNRNPFHKDFLPKGLTTDQLRTKHRLTLNHRHFFHATTTILQLRNPPW